MTAALKVRCKATSNKGEQCKRYAIKGGTVCRSHGGAAPQVKARADITYEAMSWGFTDKTVDPGETLLRLVTQSAARAQRYAAELEKLVEESPSLREALVADIWIQPERGEAYKAGEYIRGLAKLEAEERDRCANFATKAIAAGLAERQVRLAEQQGAAMFEMVKKALNEVTLTPEQSQAFMAALARQARELTS